MTVSLTASQLQKFARAKAVKKALLSSVTEKSSNNLATSSVDKSYQCNLCSRSFDALNLIARHLHEQHIQVLDNYYTQYLNEYSPTSEASGFISNNKNDVSTSVKSDAFETDHCKYTARRVPKLFSDPVSTNCCCPKSSGFVILFYKYTRISEPFVSAQKLESLCLRLKLTGKIRVAVEGLNVTLAGDKRHVNTFVKDILDWDCFAEENFDLNAKKDLDMDVFNDKRIRDFFKPTPGCAHAFPNLSVRVVEEICPLGAPELQPMKLKSSNSSNLPSDSLPSLSDSKDGNPQPLQQKYDSINGGHLSPADWHSILSNLYSSDASDTLQSSTSETPYHPLMQQLNLTSDEVLLIDTRNYYESQLGKFVNAVTPNIRKFGSWKTWVDEYLIPNVLDSSNSPSGSGANGRRLDCLNDGASQTDSNSKAEKKPKKVKAILSYCTGGIRCEKATEYVREKLREVTLSNSTDNSASSHECDSTDSKSTTQSIDVAPIPVYQLEGGIDRYLAWVADELKNKSQPTEKPCSLFLGKNYVFDSRVSVGLEDYLGAEGSCPPSLPSDLSASGVHLKCQTPLEATTVISRCKFCDTKSTNYLKCSAVGCHLLFICCEQCASGSAPLELESTLSEDAARLTERSDNATVYCCDRCSDWDVSNRAKFDKMGQTAKVKRGICECEERRKQFGWVFNG